MTISDLLQQIDARIQLSQASIKILEHKERHAKSAQDQVLSRDAMLRENGKISAFNSVIDALNEYWDHAERQETIALREEKMQENLTL